MREFGRFHKWLSEQPKNIAGRARSVESVLVVSLKGSFGEKAKKELEKQRGVVVEEVSEGYLVSKA